MAVEDPDRTLLAPGSESEAPTQEVLAPGARIRHFEVVSLLGQGGMGKVYKARDDRLDRSVAIKLLPAALSGDPERIQRFATEARAASALNHPNIVTIYETGECEWGPFLVMEMVEGKSLRQLIAERLELDQVLDLASQAAKALSVAHAAGIIHRDLKPDNILVRDDGYVKIVDFGLARLHDMDAELTATGAVVGTLRYVSPEQGRGEKVDERSDVFSLGLIFYEMVTGRHPFESGSVMATFQALTASTAEAPSQWTAGVPEELSRLILAMLDKTPAARPDARRVADSLAAMRTGLPEAPPAVARKKKTRPRRAIVGREEEREVLLAAFEAARGGHGALVSIAAEAGMGKSTLIEDYLDRLPEDSCLVGRGRSPERLAGAEAYLPMLEVLGELLHADRSGRFARELKQVAPSWHAQLLPAAETGLEESKDARTRTQERMKHELGALLRRLSDGGVVVLCFDDFHWADVSTADAVVYLAGRLEELGVVLVISYRESEMLNTEHPFVAAKLTLQTRGVTRDISLEALSLEEVESYLTLELGSDRFPAELPAKIHRRTSGHPLFVADLVRYLKKRGALRLDGDEWVFDASFEEAESELPESVRSMVDRKISLIPPEDQRLLSAAAVQGFVFDSAVVSEMLKLDAADVEEKLDELERRQALVRLVDEREMPDRTLTSRYEFAHALYQHAFLDKLRPTRKAAMAGAAARSLGAHHGERSAEIAAQLAPLFEAARDDLQAGECYLQAARSAVTVFAHREAAIMARRGLEATQRLSASSERDDLELRAQLELGGALCTTEGYASPGASACFARALELSEEMELEARGIPVIWGLWMNYLIAGDHDRTQKLAERLLRAADGSDDADFVGAAHYATGLVHEVTGDLPAARTYAEQAEKIFGLESTTGTRERVARFVVDPRNSARGIVIRTAALQGFSDLAEEAWEQCLATVEGEDTDPRSVSDVLVTGCCLGLFRHDPETVRELADRSIAVCERFDIYFEGQWSRFFRGWALTALGEEEKGLELMQAFLALITSAGTRILHSLWIATLAEALAKAGRTDEAHEWIGKGIEMVAETGQRFFESEVYRVRGELQVLAGGAEREARASFERAVEIAATQGARLLELRAALSLGRLLQRSGDSRPAAELLTRLSQEMGASFRGPELDEAKALLAELSPSS